MGGRVHGWRRRGRAGAARAENSKRRCTWPYLRLLNQLAERSVGQAVQLIPHEAFSLKRHDDLFVQLGKLAQRREAGLDGEGKGQGRGRKKKGRGRWRKTRARQHPLRATPARPRHPAPPTVTYLSHMRRSTILHSVRTRSVNCAQPRRMTISNMARNRRPARQGAEIKATVRKVCAMRLQIGGLARLSAPLPPPSCFHVPDCVM